MKVRVVLMTENDVPPSAIGNTLEEQNRNVTEVWDGVCRVLEIMGDDKISLEKAEVVQDE